MDRAMNHRATASEQRRDGADTLALFAVHRGSFCPLVGAERMTAPGMDTALPGVRHASDNAFADQVAFEISDGRSVGGGVGARPVR
jgi:uncharacterized heparinase superfamily protein